MFVPQAKSTDSHSSGIQVSDPNTERPVPDWSKEKGSDERMPDEILERIRKETEISGDE